ncbi:MAG: hypothetical protein KIT11_11760 [Fimbriimonadaceae bacterium]|nr:hypothetical protein [Fimbriimonadaceae bacterium]QYK55290.1 MAG: hypothetical protein KF733_09775 [Fimbriimonadaceae bacterium]
MTADAAQIFMSQLAGRDEAAIDEKGRVMLRQKFRDRLGTYFVLAQSEMGCLVAYPVETWAEEVKAIRGAPVHNAGRKLLNRMLVGSAETEMRFDPQGRILIPKQMREFANLQSRVVAVGCDDRLEIWAKEELAKCEADPLNYGAERREIWGHAYRLLEGSV